MEQDTRNTVIDMYLAVDEEGKPQHSVADITTETGVARSSIYYVLDAAGIPLNRIKKQSDSELAELLRESQAEVVELRARVRTLQQDLQRSQRVIDALTSGAATSETIGSA